MFSFFVFQNLISLSCAFSLLRWFAIIAVDCILQRVIFAWHGWGGGEVQLMGLPNIINQPSEIATRNNNEHTHTHRHTQMHRHAQCRIWQACRDVRTISDMRWHPRWRSLAATRAACVAICNYVINQTCNCTATATATVSVACGISRAACAASDPRGISH